LPSTAQVLKKLFAEGRQLGDAKALLDEAVQRLSVDGAIAILIQDTRAPHRVRQLSQAGFAAGALDALGTPAPLGMGEVGALRFCTAPLAGSSEQVTVVGGREADCEAISLVAVFVALALERASSGQDQSHRLQAVGTLTSGVAHDFNNVLASILAHLELAKLQPGVETSDVNSAMDSALRGRDLVRQLLTIARSQQEQRTPHRLQSLIHQSMSMMRATMPPSVGLRLALDPRAPAVMAEPGQLQQVLVNLVALAANSVTGRGTVELSLVTRGTPVGTELTITSEGEGLPVTANERALGLSVVRTIVKSHGGSLEQHPTRTVLWLPGIVDPTHDGLALDAVPGNQQRIALVDDEPMVARATERLVSQFGYQVTLFSSGDQVLRAFAAQRDAFELVLTDQTMPEMTGLELTYALRKRGVQVPVLLVTGLPTEIDSETVAPPFTVLGKPYRSEELASGLAKLLAR
jgi:signal transduction histidine kinase